MAICGSDKFAWVAYGFDDVDENDEQFAERFEVDGYRPDAIAWNSLDEVVDANKPIRDPREYFMMVLKYRAAQILREWEDLASWIVGSVEQEISVRSRPFRTNRL